MSIPKDLDRREFIKRTALFAVAVSVPGFSACHSEGEGGEIPVETNCATTADILGPFYKAGSPIKEDIIPAGNLEPPLIIEGKVLSHCDVPLKDAAVEIWNANEAGEYDTSLDFIFRGKYQTLSNGVYRFKTIIPGRYLNGSTYRPSHIHFRITAPGHGELVSQIYFKDDPFIPSDPWASASQASERILPIEKDESNMDKVTFDIHLTPL